MQSCQFSNGSNALQLFILAYVKHLTAAFDNALSRQFGENPRHRLARYASPVGQFQLGRYRVNSVLAGVTGIGFNMRYKFTANALFCIEKAEIGDPVIGVSHHTR